jgi:hypothetical protein
MKLTGLLFGCLLLSKLSAQPVDRYYYLTVGAGHYEHRSVLFKERGFLPFEDLPEANTSAQLMEGFFSNAVGAKGILLNSANHQYITRRRLFTSLAALDRQIRADHASRPFILFYYCGHGISENMAWNQFLIPGDYTHIPGSKGFEELSRDLIFLGDITDFFEKRKYPYMALIDCCRKEGKDSALPEKRLSYFFDSQNLQTFKTVVAGLKYLNEYHQTSPVVFAIRPGLQAPTVPRPAALPFTVPNMADETGPICRRSLIFYQDLLKGEARAAGIADYIKALTSNDLDPLSPVSVSFYEDKASVKFIPKRSR